MQSMTTVTTSDLHPDDPNEMTDTGSATTDLTPLATSYEIRDRGSTFVGYVYRAKTTEEARTAVAWRRQHDLARVQEREQVRHRQRHGHDHPRDEGKDGDGDRDANRNRNANMDNMDDGLNPYTIAAWRCMVVKPGRTGLGGLDEFEVKGGADDGGERHAGKKVLEAMQREGVIDAVVIISRWFGGTLLGPVRFAHVNTCASEVCRKFKKVEEMEECIQTLKRLDNILATLRAQWTTTLDRVRTANPSLLSDVPNNSRARSDVPNYHTLQQDLDLTKAKRLINARECAIQNTKGLIEKYKTSI